MKATLRVQEGNSSIAALVVSRPRFFAGSAAIVPR